MQRKEAEETLDGLFRAYRAATEYEGAAPDFMPKIWARIESRKKNAMVMIRLGRVFATGAVTLAALAGLFVSLAPPRTSDETWVEALANQQLAQNAPDYEPVRLAPAKLPGQTDTPRSDRK